MTLGITLDELLLGLPPAMQELLRDGWLDVVRALPLVGAGQVLLLVSDGQQLQVSIDRRAALRRELATWPTASLMTSVLTALESEPGPGLVRLIVIAPTGSLALRVPHPGAYARGGSA